MRVTTDMICPELRGCATVLRLLMPPYTLGRFRFEKAMCRLLKGVHSQRMRFEQVFLPRADKSRLRLCVYAPKVPKTGAPGLLWLHGGGYAIGVPEQDEGTIWRLVRASGCTVVAPDYTLSLDAPYPAALHDAYAALLWLKKNGGKYGVREDQLFVVGQSAGGGLAAALALYARDRGEVSLAYMMPLYPMLDDRMETGSMRDNDAPAWNAKSNDVAWRLYLGDLFGAPDVPSYAAPSRAADLSGLPPACSFVGGVDPFCDETKAFFDHLNQQGIPARLKVFEGCFHGFDLFRPRSEVGKEAAAFMMDAFLYAAKHYTAAQPEREP